MASGKPPPTPDSARPPSFRFSERQLLRGLFAEISESHPGEKRRFSISDMDAQPARRTLFTTLLGAGVVFLGALGTIFSLFALLMAVGKPYAVSHTSLLDVLVLFILPPGTLLAGIGLILRQRWARWWIILLAVGLLWVGVIGFINPWDKDPAFGGILNPAADTLHRVRLVQTLACIGAGGAVLLGLFSAPVRREFKKLTDIPPP